MSELHRKWNDFSEKRITESLRKNETNAWDLVPRSIIDDVEKEIKLYRKLSEINDKIEKIASDVCGFYGDEFSYDVDDYYGASGEMRFRCVLNRDMEERNDVYKYSGRLARQKQSELNELIKQKQALISELNKDKI